MLAEELSTRTIPCLSSGIRHGSFNAGRLRAAEAVPDGAEPIIDSIAGATLHDADDGTTQGTPPRATAPISPERVAAILRTRPWLEGRIHEKGLPATQSGLLADMHEWFAGHGPNAALRSFAASHGDLHQRLIATLAAFKRNRATRNRLQTARAWHDIRTWQVERRKRTLHLIKLG